MPLSKAAISSLTPEELSFLAENELVTIVPLYSIESLHLISATYGPFEPPFKLGVPLWLARTLRKKNKCIILPPHWLNPSNLKQKLEEERQSLNFSKMPYTYIEMANFFLECSPSEFPDFEETMTLIKDISETRQAKYRLGISKLDTNYLQMDNLGSIETYELRGFITNAVNSLNYIENQK